ncbi:MAG TPA: GNAT family N-acetyltransferase [Chloroflexia bacterium]|jgi:mycothiol synthase
MDGVLKGLRPYSPDDLPQLRQLLTEAEAWPPASPPADEDILTRWKRRGVVPLNDVSVLPGPDGDLIAFSQAFRYAHGVSRLSFEIGVHPQHRQKGFGGALYRLVEARAREMGVPHMTTPVFITSGVARPECSSFLERRGFRVESSYWQMRIDDLESQAPARWPSGIDCRPFGDPIRDAPRWAQIIRDTFNEPATAEGIVQQLSEEGVSPQGYFFAVDRETGLEVGTTRSRIDYIGGQPVGYIGTVGVLASYRGRGIAEALVRHTLQYLASAGMTSATLFVESQNTAARNLYTKMGWRPVYRTDHYWRRLPLSTDPERL